MKVPLAARVAIPVAALLLASKAPSQDEGRPLVERTWAGCAACHAAPDHRVAHDVRWIGLNRTTTCLTGEAATELNRTKLIAWLVEGQAPLPELVLVKGSEADDGEGIVRVPATSGSAYLRRIEGEGPETLRLHWGESKEGATLAVPLGTYELVNHCFYREDKNGVQWTASATVQEGEAPDRLEVDSGAATALGIEPVLYHDLTATAAGPKLDVSFQMRNEAGDRMTLTRQARLVEPTWVATSVDGEELASGRFTPS